MAAWLRYLLNISPLAVLVPLVWRYRFSCSRLSLRDTLLVLLVVPFDEGLVALTGVQGFHALCIYTDLGLTVLRARQREAMAVAGAA